MPVEFTLTRKIYPVNLRSLYTTIREITAKTSTAVVDGHVKTPAVDQAVQMNPNAGTATCRTHANTN